MTFKANDKVEMNISSYTADMLKRFDIEAEARGTGHVIEVTPYKVHVRWSNGQELAHHHTRIKAAA